VFCLATVDGDSQLQAEKMRKQESLPNGHSLLDRAVVTSSALFVQSQAMQIVLGLKNERMMRVKAQCISNTGGSMKKCQSNKRAVLTDKQTKIGKPVDLVDEAPLNKQSCNSKIHAVRPQSVDVTHRFGKRSGST
jgi:hypothetical protein